MSRGRAAEPKPWGSILQCYSLNRTKPRTATCGLGISPHARAAYSPKTVVGSKIALFGCLEPHALDRIGDIELAEGLPHPMINGLCSRNLPNRVGLTS